MTDQDRKHLATSFIEALRAGDADGFRSIMTDDVLWTLPRTSLVSGIANGVEGVLKRARSIVEYGASVEIRHVVLGYEGVALLLHNTGKRNERILDEYLTTVCTLRNGKIARLDTYTPILKWLMPTSLDWHRWGSRSPLGESTRSNELNHVLANLNQHARLKTAGSVPGSRHGGRNLKPVSAEDPSMLGRLN